MGRPLSWIVQLCEWPIPSTKVKKKKRHQDAVAATAGDDLGSNENRDSRAYILVVAGSDKSIIAKIAADVGGDDLAIDTVSRYEVLVHSVRVARVGLGVSPRRHLGGCAGGYPERGRKSKSERIRKLLCHGKQGVLKTVQSRSLGRDGGW